MLIHSKELLLSGKKQPDFFRQSGSQPILTIGYPKLNDVCFAEMTDVYTIVSITNSLGSVNSTIKVTRGDISTTGAFRYSIHINGFLFHVYQGYRNFMYSDFVVSPNQAIGDRVIWTAIRADLSLPYIHKIDGNTIYSNNNGMDFTATITNTPVTDYIYRA